LHRVALVVVFIAVFSLDMILSCPNISTCLLMTRYNSTISYNLKPFVASNRVGELLCGFTRTAGKDRARAEKAETVLLII